MKVAITLSIIPLVIMLLSSALFSISRAQGQTFFPCPDGYQRNQLGLCVPIVSLNPNIQGCPVGYIKSSSGFCELIGGSSLTPPNNVTNQTRNQEWSLAQQLPNTGGAAPLQPPQPLQQQPQQGQPPSQSYPPSSAQQQQWFTHEDPVNGIRIQIPSNWQIVSGQPDKIVEFKLPSVTKPSFGAGPALDADLSISQQNTGSYLDTNTLQVKGATLEDYVEAEKNRIRSGSSPTGELGLRLEYLKDNQTTVGGNPAWQIEYISYISGRQGLYNVETYVMKNNILYTLKFFSDPLKVPETLPIAQKMIDSFQIVGQ